MSKSSSSKTGSKDVLKSDFLQQQRQLELQHQHQQLQQEQELNQKQQQRHHNHQNQSQPIVPTQTQNQLVQEQSPLIQEPFLPHPSKPRSRIQPIDESQLNNKITDLSKSQRMELAYEFYLKIQSLPTNEKWSNRKIAKYHGISEGGLRARLKRGTMGDNNTNEIDNDRNIASLSLQKPIKLNLADEKILIEQINDMISNNLEVNDTIILLMANRIHETSTNNDLNGNENIDETFEKNISNSTYINGSWVKSFKRRNKELFKTKENNQIPPSNQSITTSTSNTNTTPKKEEEEDNEEQEEQDEEEGTNYDPSLPEPKPLTTQEINQLSKTQRMEKAFEFNQLQKKTLPPKQRWSNRKIAKIYGVSESGFRGRLKRGNEQINGHIKRRKISIEEEQLIKKKLNEDLQNGENITSSIIINLANNIIKDNDSSNFVTKSWVKTFKKRNPDLVYNSNVVVDENINPDIANNISSSNNNDNS